MGTRVLREFEYIKPTSIEEVMSMLGKWGEKAKVLAGGSDLLVMMKLLNVRPECLVDITGINELKGITLKEKEVKIGATSLLNEVASSRLIQEKYIMLFEAASKMATTQVRNIGTIGGNLCNASPAADTATPLLALSAKVEIASQSDKRTVPLEKFFTGPGETVLTPTEIVTSISIPVPTQHTGTSFIKISRTANDLATLNVAVNMETVDGKCRDVKIALGAVAPIPMRARKTEDFLRNREINQGTIAEAATIVTKEINPITDVRSTAEYRKDVTAVVTQRALLRAYERSKR